MNPSLKVLAFVCLISLAAPIWAQSPPPPPGDFNAAKQHRLQKIARHLEKLRRNQACVQNAADLTQLQSCPQPHRR